MNRGNLSAKLTLTEETQRRFSMPDSIIGEYKYWAVLLRPKQVTLGSLVIMNIRGATNFSSIAKDEGQEMYYAISQTEKLLKGTFKPDKINFLCYMMKDPEVMFHVIPRYESAREFGGVVFEDTGWPKYPEMKKFKQPGEYNFAKLRDLLRAEFRKLSCS